MDTKLPLLSLPGHVKSGSLSTFSSGLMKCPGLAKPKLWNWLALALIPWLSVGMCYLFHCWNVKVLHKRNTCCKSKPDWESQTRSCHSSILSREWQDSVSTAFLPTCVTWHLLQQNYKMSHNSSSLHLKKSGVISTLFTKSIFLETDQTINTLHKTMSHSARHCALSSIMLFQFQDTPSFKMPY